MADTDKIIDKIQKLKAHEDSARSIGSIEEAEAFAIRIQELLLKYELSLSDIEFKKRQDEEPIQIYDLDWQGVKVRKVRVAWQETLGGIVARAHHCRLVVIPRSSALQVIGRISNVKVVEYILVVLVRSVEKMAYQAMVTYYAELRRSHHCDTDQFRRSYINGFVHRIAERFYEEQKRREAAPATSTALVRLNAEDLATEEYRDRLKKSKLLGKASRVDGAQSGYNRVGLSRGRQAADNVPLGANAFEGTARSPKGDLR